MNSKPNRVAVIGAGTIGVGWIALLLAHGHTVRAYTRDRTAEHKIRARVELASRALDGGLVGALSVTDDLAEAVSDAEFVIESASERLDLKRELFAAVSDAAPASAILLSSTSTLLPDDLGSGLADPGRVLVAHPFNPPHVIPLVELLGASTTTPEVLDAAEEFLRGLDRVPVRLRAPIAGFVANRLQTALLREAIHLVQQGVATIDEIDTAVTRSIGLRWATIGPFQALHLGGGPGGLRQWFAHIGVGLAAGWGQLGRPELDQRTVDALIEQAERAYGEPGYDEQVAARDARQLAVLDALGERA